MPPLIQVFAHLPQDDLHPPHVVVQELHHLFALPQYVQHLNNSWFDLWSKWISQTTQSDFSRVFHHLFPRILESTRQFMTQINLNIVFSCHIIIWQNWHLWRLSSFWKQKYNQIQRHSFVVREWFLTYKICVSLLVYTNLLKFNLMANISWIWFRVTQFCRIWCNKVGSSREYLLKNNKYIRFAETFNKWYINTSARFFDQQYHTIICCGFSESCSWNFCGIIFSTLLVKYCRQLLRDSIQVNRISF